MTPEEFVRTRIYEPPHWDDDPTPSFSQRDPGAFLLLLYVGLLTGLFALGFALGRVSVYLL